MLVVLIIAPMEHLTLWLDEKRGRRGELATALGITPGALSQWTQVPAERAIAVEKATGISRHVLRPDLSRIFLTDPSPTPSLQGA